MTATKPEMSGEMAVALLRYISAYNTHQQAVEQGTLENLLETMIKLDRATQGVAKQWRRDLPPLFGGIA